MNTVHVIITVAAYYTLLLYVTSDEFWCYMIVGLSLSFTCMHILCAAQILDPPESQSVPVDTNATFTCRTVHGRPLWELNGLDLDAAVLTSEAIQNLATRGIYFTRPEMINETTMEQYSTLTVTGSRESNGTIVIRCKVVVDVFQSDLGAESDRVMLSVFGKSISMCIWYTFKTIGIVI